MWKLRAWGKKGCTHWGLPLGVGEQGGSRTEGQAGGGTTPSHHTHRPKESWGEERGSRAGLPLMNTSIDLGVMGRQTEMCLVRGVARDDLRKV